MLLGRKKQYCENDCMTRCNLQIQYNPYQITNVIFHRTRTKNFTIHMKTQKIPNSQCSHEEEEARAEGIKLPEFRLYHKATVIIIGVFFFFLLLDTCLDTQAEKS